MANFAAGKRALGICDRCGFQYKLNQLKKLTIKQRDANLLVCPECWEQDQPQLMLGTKKVFDPQALRDPRPDNYEAEAQLLQWGWNPVGYTDLVGGRSVDNNLSLSITLNSVTVQTQ